MDFSNDLDECLKRKRRNNKFSNAMVYVSFLGSKILQIRSLYSSLISTIAYMTKGTALKCESLCIYHVGCNSRDLVRKMKMTKRQEKQRKKDRKKKKRRADFQYMYKVSSECGLKPDSSVGQSIRTEFSGHWFKLHSDQLPVPTSKNPSVVNTICINSFHYQSARFRLKQIW